MSLTTRPPTCLPSWPILLIAGAEKAGKSWACAEASASELIDRTLWIGVGEDDPDEYGQIPGARFEIVVHDGTYRGILRAVTEAAAEPKGDRPNLLVLDSATRLWEMLCDLAQQEANRREAAKAARFNKPLPDDDVPITVDLWNVAKDRWQHVIGALREHQGPSIVTARLDEVTVIENGRPTKEKTVKVKAEKSLPYEVGPIIHLPERGKAFLTGVRSVRMQLPKAKEIKGFTVDGLWREMGLAETVGARTHSGASGERITDAEWHTGWVAKVQACDSLDKLRDLWTELTEVFEQGDVTEDDKAAGSKLVASVKAKLEGKPLQVAS